MITFLEGSLIEKYPTRAIINVNGVGYETLIPLSSYQKLPSEGEQVKLLTYFHVREDAQQLFGFMDSDERELFRLLISVSGVGPKIGLSALSGLNPNDLKRAIIESDLKMLGTISGVGKKMAERLALELRDKFSQGEALAALSGTAETSASVKLQDAISALVSLGYKEGDAFKMIDRIKEKEALGVEELIRKALAG